MFRVQNQGWIPSYLLKGQVYSSVANTQLDKLIILFDKIFEELSVKQVVVTAVFLHNSEGDLLNDEYWTQISCVNTVKKPEYHICDRALFSPTSLSGYKSKIRSYQLLVLWNPGLILCRSN